MARINHTSTVLLALTATIASLGGCVALLLALEELMAAHSSVFAALCTVARASFTASTALASLRRRHERKPSKVT